MNDRIQAAWELRAAIHRHVAANPRCTIESILTALPGANRHTVRRAMQKMRTDGDIAMVSNKANMGRYMAITASIRPVKAVREKLSAGGRASQPLATAGWKRKAQERKITPENKATRWTARQDAALREMYATTTAMRIAEIIGRSVASIQSRAFQLGITKHGANGAGIGDGGRVTVVNGPVTTHRGTDRDRPLIGQRGQGCVIARAHISCHQEY